MNVLFVCNKGGHYSQMMELKTLMAKYNSFVLTEKQNADADFSGFAKTKSMYNYMVMKHKKLRFLKALWDCNKYWHEVKPKYIISTGAAFSLPMYIVGKLHRSKLIYIETRAKVYTPTRTGKQVSKFCDKLIVQWPEMLEVYGSKAEYYGILA
ncbi:MAG: capsular biosynthesis protein CpsF [Bacteroidales bacterium]|jgi:UDP-N-acetylglucosamine:LPS N-acetylglucosamine transferase|nr:capsular biosynthesis protein CpsF [Bacteroidales bacterium]